MMLPSRPPGTEINIAKSSWKKLLPFMQEMQKRGVIKIKDQKGTQHITHVESDHPDLRDFTRVHGKAALPDRPSSVPGSSQGFVRRTITLEYLYQLPTNGIFLFPGLGLSVSKGNLHNRSQLREALATYVSRNGLGAPDGGVSGLISVDPQLAHLLGTQENILALPFDRILDGIAQKSVGWTNVTSSDPAIDPILNRGAVPSLRISTQRRAGNKWVTVLLGFEHYLIDSKQLISELQVVCASSATIDTTPEGTSAIVVQGRLLREIITHLTTIHGVPPSNIDAPELKKKA
eukprot:TRINITY_DN7367_c0_g1_i1.p1 TRINITY_DN7367_c0_g1~~TRINITY_DN7367_c0_g1_i1.p1  ORF type:complete len:290 (+),score=58.66 TRINITY_DN7367_c0_g1_i1:732-1601(+)